ncbi:hypothetical protein [Streptomyces sp. NBC_01207]|uniref:hypothetical protein n=1 Tax=Streptomyces sp. NBC_01207 TaxID=2903772 RepID=UPI002E0F6649|nr:hypothetical protein OG457_23945 [Streptomyces sp. NBC_01207]
MWQDAYPDAGYIRVRKNGLGDALWGSAGEGAPDPVRRTAFERALTDIRDRYRDRIAAVSGREALAHLALHRRLKSAGTSIDPPDALIAVTALANGWTLVSRNIKHLARSGALLLNPWEYEGWAIEVGTRGNIRLRGK